MKLRCSSRKLWRLIAAHSCTLIFFAVHFAKGQLESPNSIDATPIVRIGWLNWTNSPDTVNTSIPRTIWYTNMTSYPLTNTVYLVTFTAKSDAGWENDFKVGGYETLSGMSGVITNDFMNFSLRLSAGNSGVYGRGTISIGIYSTTNAKIHPTEQTAHLISDLLTIPFEIPNIPGF